MKHEYELKAERFKQTVYRMSKIVGDGYLKGVNGQDLSKIEISIGATKPDETGMRRLYLKLFATNGFAVACARLESTAGREAVNADAKELRQNMFGRAAVVAPKAFLDAIRAKIRGLKRDARISYDDETGVLAFESEQVPTELVIGDNPLSAIFDEEYAVPGAWKYLYQCSGYCWDHAMKRYEAEAKRKWNLTPTKFARTASAVLQTIDGNLWIQAQKDDDRRQCVERLDAIDLKEAIASESAPANLFEPARFNYEMLCELVKFANPAKDFVRICRFKDSLAYSFYNSYRCQSYEAILIALEDAQSIEPATARDRVKANEVNDRPDARCASPANTVSNASGGESGSSSPKQGTAPSPSRDFDGLYPLDPSGDRKEDSKARERYAKRIEKLREMVANAKAKLGEKYWAALDAEADALEQQFRDRESELAKAQVEKDYATKIRVCQEIADLMERRDAIGVLGLLFSPETHIREIEKAGDFPRVVTKRRRVAALAEELRKRLDAPATARDRVKADGVNDRPDARCATLSNTVSNANGDEPGSSSPKPGPAPSPALDALDALRIVQTLIAGILEGRADVLNALSNIAKTIG